VNYKKIKEQNIKFFSNTLKSSPNEHHSVAQSEISHLKRFEKILELGKFNNKRILDVGCGIGGFYGFLREQDIHTDYTGIDINEHMIDAAKKKYPELQNHFFVHDIIEKEMNETFDYIISVGPLNLKFEGSSNTDITMELIKKMYKMANIGIAISMTSSLTKRENKKTFYYDPVKILSRTFEFCKNVKFDHTYIPHDFVLFCYKKDLYDF